MIEVNFIDIFANGGTPTDILKKKMTPTVCISSAKPNAALKVEVVYSISSSNTDYDQILCSETVENIPAGMVEFDLETEIPDLSKIPREQLLGLASILFLFYTEDGHQFVRVGYFVKIDYPGVQLIETPREYQEDAFELEEMEYSSEGARAEEAEQMVEKEAMQPIGTEENAEKEEDSQEQENPEDDMSIGAEEAEEANKEEIKPEGVHDGILFITEENFKAMDIDMSKIEGQILDPPLVTVFTEAWTAAEKEENSRQPEEE